MSAGTGGIRAGAVVFDAADEPGLGWACRAHERPFRIQGVEALASDTLWWVNTSFSAMREAGLASNVFYRPTDFLRLPMLDSLMEWGAFDDERWPVDAAGGAGLMAGLFDRVIRLHCAHFGMARASWRPPRFAFRAAIREALIPPDQRLERSLFEATAEAYQAYANCQTSQSAAKSAFVSLPRPRLAHALEVLSTPVPAAANGETVRPPARGQSVSDWLSHHPGPMLCRVTLSDMDAEVAKLINFGSHPGTRTAPSRRGRGYQSASMRQWLTGDEVKVYAPFAEITVHEAIFWPDWVRPVDAIGALRSFAAVIEEYDHLAPSLGLYSEQLWTGLAMPHVPPGERRDRTQNVLAPFLRAADRMGCLHAARRVQDQGVTVTGYGVGRVGVRVEAVEAGRQLVEIAAIAGLLAPLQQHSPLETPPVSINGDPHADARLQIAAGGWAQDYAAVDEEVVGTFSEAIAPPKAQNG